MVDWDDLAEIQIPGGARLISKERVIETLLNQAVPMPEATMDGPVRKSSLSPFLHGAVTAPTEELTPAERNWLELAWNALYV